MIFILKPPFYLEASSGEGQAVVADTAVGTAEISSHRMLISVVEAAV